MALQLIERLVGGEAANPRLYSPDAVRVGFPALVEREFAALTRAYGPVSTVVPRAGKYEIVLGNALVRLTPGLDAGGRLTSLIADPPAANGTLGQIVEQIKALPGETALYVATDDRPVVEHRPDEPLAVGSAFKLAVLAALQTSDCAPETCVAIRPELKSLPSGILQNWPDHAILTVQSLAILMISISDNTATDLLIHRLGRKAVEEHGPLNRPFLTTREAFQLKMCDRKELRARWQEADESERLEILRALAGEAAPGADSLEAHPTLGIEWHFTARDVAALLALLRGNDALAINPGPMTASDWAAYAYKGGSDRGALNFSLEVLGHDGRRHTVIVTWNDPAGDIDQEKLVFLTRGLANQL